MKIVFLPPVHGEDVYFFLENNLDLMGCVIQVRANAVFKVVLFHL